MSTSSARFEDVTTQDSTANLQDSTTPTDAECFRAIDSWVREKEREWAAVARACLEVQNRELWIHGGFHSYDAWLQSAAPSSARTIYWHVSLLKGLEDDFTDEELSKIRPESAKVVKRLSTSVRRDPRVREAAKGKKQALVATIKELHPDQLLEDESMLAFSLSDTQRSIVDEEFDYWRKQDAEISDSEILVALCLAAGEIRKSERSL